ncbi:MAG: hypothetical protein HY903_20535 [Deltaproteobacteria bacterium]|nr:hypothetical protein [Deltaproteobacteria bacterium]
MSMRTRVGHVGAALPWVLFVGWGCGSSVNVTTSGTYRSALDGDACTPQADSFVPRDTGADHGQASGNSDNGGNGNVSPTGIPGDNMDDTRSGKIDCYYDGNSGQGDDKKHPCTAADFPQPGCDAAGCCEDGVLPAPDDDPPDADRPDAPDPTDDPAADPPTQDPAPDEPSM